MSASGLKRMKEMEREILHFKRMYADVAMEKRGRKFEAAVGVQLLQLHGNLYYW